MRLGRHAEALADFEEILELSRGTKYGDLFGAFHALTKARLGDLSALALLGDQVRETLRLGVGQKTHIYGYYMLYYDAACIHCALAKRRSRIGANHWPNAGELAQRDLDRALELLDKARATGEFKRMIRLDEVRTEPLLDPLRANPRFQLLMMDLAFPDDPFRP